MSQGSHTREQIRKQLSLGIEKLIDAVEQALEENQPMEAEQLIAKAGDALTAKAIGEWLLFFDRDDELLRIDGRLYYRLGEPVEKTYSTQRGDVRLRRRVYRPRGVHNGATASPLELSVGMVGGQWTPGCAAAMAYVVQELPERSTAKVAARLGAMSYSYSSFQRLRSAMAEKWVKDRDLFE